MKFLLISGLLLSLAACSPSNNQPTPSIPTDNVSDASSFQLLDSGSKTFITENFDSTSVDQNENLTISASSLTMTSISAPSPLVLSGNSACIRPYGAGDSCSFSITIPATTPTGNYSVLARAGASTAVYVVQVNQQLAGAGLTVMPLSLNFGTMMGSQNSLQIVTLKNTKVNPITGLSVSFGTSNFSVISNSCGTQVPANGNCLLRVDFSAAGKTAPQTINDNLTINATGLSSPIVIPTTVMVAVNTTPVNLTLTANPPGPLNLGTYTPTQNSGLQSITIKNLGPQTALGLVTSVPTGYVLGSSCLTSLSAGQTCVIRYTFSAVGKAGGVYAGNISVASSFQVGVAINIPITVSIPVSPTPTPTPTPTPSPSPTPTATPTPSPIPTATPTPSPSPTPSATPTPTPSPTPTPTPSPSPSPSATPSGGGPGPGNPQPTPPNSVVGLNKIWSTDDVYGAVIDNTYHINIWGTTSTSRPLVDSDFNGGQGVAPAGTYTDVSLSRYVGCAIRATDQTAVCWGGAIPGASSDRGSEYPPLGTKFKSIGAGDFSSCGIDINNNLICWGTNSGTAPPVTTMSYIDKEIDGIWCGVDTGSHIRCWGGTHPGGADPFPNNNNMIQVAQNDYQTCGLQNNGQVLCSQISYFGATTVFPPSTTTFLDIKVSGFGGCGILDGQNGQVQGRLSCWFELYHGTLYPFTFPADEFIALDSSEYNICGLTTDSQSKCWNINSLLANTGINSPPAITFMTLPEPSPTPVPPYVPVIQGAAISSTGGLPVMIKDLNVGSGDSSPNGFIGLGNRTIFTANDGNFENELWMTDGTAAGTSAFVTLSTGNGSFYPVFLGSLNGKTYFVANTTSTTQSGSAYYWRLWVTDGTAAGTLQLSVGIRDGSLEGADARFYDWNGTALIALPGYCTGFTQASCIDNSQLIMTDGTQSGTTTIGSFPSIPGNAIGPIGFLTFQNRLYFTSTDSHGSELWMDEALNTSVKFFEDLFSGSSSSYPSNLTSLTNNLFIFSANNGSGNKLWSSDGSVAGTGVISSVSPASIGLVAKPYVVINNIGYLYDSSYNLITTDGTSAGTSIIKSFTYLEQIVLLGNNKIAFVADDGINGRQPWVSDGTTAGTNLIKIISPTGETTPYLFGPQYLTSFNGRVYFSGNDQVHGDQLWVTDGTAPGTAQIIINPSGSSFPNHQGFNVVNGALYFQATDGVHGLEPYVLSP